MRDEIDSNPNAFSQMATELDIASFRELLMRSATNNKDDSREFDVAQFRDLVMKSLGPGDNAGDMPTMERPSYAKPEDFKPNNLCLLYIKVEGTQIIFRHAYVDISAISHDNASLGNLATPIFAGIAKNQPDLTKIKRYTNGPTWFGFGSQHIIMILLDNNGGVAKFNDSNSPDDVIRFSKFCSQRYGGNAKNNCNFYDLRAGPDIAGLDGTQTFLLNY
ncbi:MAG: hypothetical protein JWO25_3266 [Alphaproteobacteria bacterium]|nr:hypothetical protein [Alphaproteobacteria bacterium]